AAQEAGVLHESRTFLYARAGVREYLALDPTGVLLPERGRGWRVVDGVYRLWEPDAAARGQNEQIAVAIGLEGMLATIYTREGERQLREGEVGQERAHDRAELERLRAELERLRGRVGER